MESSLLFFPTIITHTLVIAHGAIKKIIQFGTGYITDVAVSSTGKYFVTAESDQQVMIWNMPNRVVIHKDNQADVSQILLLEGIPPVIIAISKLKCNKTGSLIYRHAGSSTLTAAVLEINFNFLCLGQSVEVRVAREYTNLNVKLLVISKPFLAEINNL
jgi:WD40 repeat protein